MVLLAVVGVAPPPTPPPALPCNDLQPPGQGKWFAAVPSNRAAGPSNRFDCEFFAAYPELCLILGNITANFGGMRAGEVCCACGGGNFGRTVPEQRRFALRRPHALHRVKPQRHFGV